jgi:DNA-binding NtrC family response regulator
MAPIKEAMDLVRGGRFGEALTVLDKTQVCAADRVAADVLRTELFDRVGEYDLASSRATALLSSTRLTSTERSTCCFVLAHVDRLAGRADSSIAFLQRAIGFAEQDRNDERAVWAKLRLLNLIAEQSGVEATVPLLSDVRANAIRTGDPVLLAAVHLYVAQAEAKRGLLASPRKHVHLALEHLKTAPNLWLEAMASHIETAIAIMCVDFSRATRYAKRGVELAERSGVAEMIVTCVGTLAHVHTMTGNFDAASHLHDWSEAKAVSGSDNHITIIESLARIRLLQNRLEESDGLLTKAEELNAGAKSSLRYVHRHILMTRADLLARRQLWPQALESIEIALHWGQRASDQLFIHTAALKKAELLSFLLRTDDGIEVIRRIAPSVTAQPADVRALYERALGFLPQTETESGARMRHLSRARRIYQALNHAPGTIELDWLQNLTSSSATFSAGNEPPGTSSHGTMLQAIAAAFAFADRPDLVTREVAEAAWLTDHFMSVAAILRRPSTPDECLTTFGTRIVATEKSLIVGTSADGEFVLTFGLNQGVEPVAVFEAVRVLLESIRQLQVAKAEREERATLWPVDELPVEGDRSVISGHMRELMTYVRRIAKTKVNVLITGESGTGKEIIARAIHDFSDRAKKPFVPFNCTAVPRDLLESQLFGHRRGAFTGADRDHLGLIRTAREGTLFLDEVGELGLDLQPKLLRFLESGEVAPLGEPGPITVDVRIVAATNSNLEEAVQAGKFREDLFYRLNVVRLSLRPLRERRDEIPTFVSRFVAQAAAEFGKGHLTVAEETMERLLLYRWPGNVRQLHNEIRRIVALAEPNSTIGPDAIDDDIIGALPVFRRPRLNGSELSVPLQAKLLPTLARIECEMIRAALKEHGGKVNAVARALGISRKGLYLKRQRLGL